MESILETYPKYIIPVLELIKDKFAKEVKVPTMIPILRKLYKPVFRFINKQIFIKDREFMYDIFLLNEVLDNVNKMNQLLNKSIVLQFNQLSKVDWRFSSMILIFLVLMNIIELTKRIF